jgi:DNA polymerase I-like protein with 3'-5' exonuclease and polymerase domains
MITANTPALARFYLNLIRKSDLIVVDIETAGSEEYEDGLDWRKGFIVSVGFYGRIGSRELVFHIPLNHNRYQCLSKPFFVEILKRFFSDLSLKIVGHGFNFDRHFIERMDIPVKNFWMDTQVAYHITHSAEERVGLKEVSIKEYSAPMEKFRKIFGKKNPIQDSDPAKFETYLYNDLYPPAHGMLSMLWKAGNRMISTRLTALTIERCSSGVTWEALHDPAMR